jgi:8-oxo-dGTP pyrophosphatase MutT (NUDIX family)
MKFGAESKTGEASTPRAAATVLLLREAAPGFEVFMVKRSGLSDVLGEAHVFPGGKVDAADASEAMLARIDGTEALDAAALGDGLNAADALALYVAAARETFEEAGVLLAHAPAGDLAAARTALNGGAAFADVLCSLNARLNLGLMAPWVRWITPRFLAKRFDARFFLALTPENQDAVHDDHEATQSEWLRPQDALARAAAGEIKLAPATWMSLNHLAMFASAQAALTDARSRRPPLIEPHAFEIEGVRHLALPGAPEHEANVAAIPGPVRLKWDGARFVPA